MQSSKLGRWKGYNLAIEGLLKGNLFCNKNGIKEGYGVGTWADPPRITFWVIWSVGLITSHGFENGNVLPPWKSLFSGWSEETKEITGNFFRLPEAD